MLGLNLNSNNPPQNKKKIFNSSKVKISRAGLSTNPVQNYNFTSGDIYSNTGATNFVNNADFSQGLTSWIPYVGNVKPINSSIQNNYINFIVSNFTDGLSQNYTSIVGHKYYFSLIANSPNNAPLQYGLATSGVGTSLTLATTVPNVDTKFSAIVSATIAYSQIVWGRGLGTYNIKNPLVVDLTAIFGAGNEPTQAWCDANISFFTGTQDVLSPTALVKQGSNFFIGGDTATFTFDLGTKIALSNVECPMKIYRCAMNSIQPPTNIAAVSSLGFAEITTQSEFDNLKTQDLSCLNRADVNNSIIEQLMIELDLTPLCNSLFGGSNAALKSAMKSFQFDVWASGFGVNSGVQTYGVQTAEWTGSAWSAVPQVSTSSSIAKISKTLTSGFDIRVNSNNKIYILVNAQYPSNGTIASSVSLDYVNIKVDLARTPDTVQPIQVNLPKYWGILVKGYSPIYDSNFVKAQNYAIFSFSNSGADRITLWDMTSNSLMLDYWNGVSVTSLSLPLGTYSKNQGLNILCGVNANGWFLYFLRNNGTIIKATTAKTLSNNTIYSFYPLYSAALGVTRNANSFVEGYTLLDLSKLGKTNGFTDAEAELMLRGNNFTLTNLLGDAGNCEDLSKWGYYNQAMSLDSSIRLYGNYSFKASSAVAGQLIDVSCDQTHKYFVSGYCYISSYTSGAAPKLYYSDFGSTTSNGVTISFDVSKLNQWQRKSVIVTNKNNGGFRFLFGETASDTVAVSNFDGMMIYDLTQIYGAGKEPVDIAQLEKDLPFTDNTARNLIGASNTELFDINKVALAANATLNNGIVTFNPTAAGQSSSITIPVFPNNKYELKGFISDTIVGAVVTTEYYNNIVLRYNVCNLDNLGLDKTFITGSNANNVKIQLYAVKAGTVQFSNISLRRKD